MRKFQFFKPIDANAQRLNLLRSKPASYWQRLGEKTMLRLFGFCYKNVPAYKNFLGERNINGGRIKTIEDFKRLPLIDKNVYLRRHNFLDLLPKRNLSLATTISATSGSSGESFYFPRGEEQDWQYEYVAELFLNNQFEIEKKKTLGIIGFGLGIWIGGIFTYKNLNKIAAKGYPLSLVTVGPDIDLFLKVIKKFGQVFDQIILMGYPPFIKDVIDEAKDYQINWKDYRVRILTAAEGYSEKFRDYATRKAAIKNPLTDFVNIYGTVEMGTMAHETPIANLIRRIVVDKKEVFKKIFPDATRLPTLAQYHPYLVYFEEMNGEIIASGFGSSIPLIRYRFPDMGGVIDFDEMVEKLGREGVDIFSEARKRGIEKTIFHLPFVYVYERSDHAVIVRGANIYPDEIKICLQNREIDKFVTGKFTMIKKENRWMNEYFEINVELKKKIKPTLKIARKIQEMVVLTLKEINSEFRDQYQSASKIMTPPILLWSYRHQTYFKGDGKQKWSLKLEN